jgi:hypothetical protein
VIIVSHNGFNQTPKWDNWNHKNQLRKVKFRNREGASDGVHPFSLYSPFCYSVVHEPKTTPTRLRQAVARQPGLLRALDWFIEGASRPEGFDLDFAKHAEALDAVTSLAAARQMLATAYANAVQFLGSRGEEDLARPLPPGPVMGGQAISHIVWAMVEHSAHHRGALTVYSRQLGKVPPMPYGG